VNHVEIGRSGKQINRVTVNQRRARFVRPVKPSLSRMLLNRRNITQPGSVQPSLWQTCGHRPCNTLALLFRRGRRFQVPTLQVFRERQAACIGPVCTDSRTEARRVRVRLRDRWPPQTMFTQLGVRARRKPGPLRIHPSAPEFRADYMYDTAHASDHLTMHVPYALRVF
jgi:hypothetical protein